MKAKEVLTKIGKWILTFLGGIALGLVVMFQWRKTGEQSKQSFEKPNEGEIENHAETERTKTRDAILRTPSATIANQYEGVGDAIDRGTNRFTSGVKAILQRKRGTGTHDRD